jgi:hypothetical protein
MKFLNIWITEYLDYSIFKQFSCKSSINIIVHNAGLARVKYFSKDVIVSPMYWMSQKDLSEYGSLKIDWEKNTRERYRLVFNRFLEINKIDPIYSYAIERLFYHAKCGCLDSLAFAKSYLKQAEENYRLKVIVGGDYRLTELSTLVWWIAVCEEYLDSSNIEYFFASKKNKLQQVNDANELLHKLSSIYTVETNIFGDIPNTIDSSGSSLSLAWVGALRYVNGWSNVIQKYSDQLSSNIVKVANKGQFENKQSPCLEIVAGNGDSDISLTDLFNGAKNVINNGLDGCDDITGTLSIADKNMVFDYFNNILSEYICSHLSHMVTALEGSLGKYNIGSFFSVTAPLMESIALHAFMKRREILPILLPHSWSSSHEYPSVSYHKSLTFIRSENILVSAFDDAGLMDKELVIPFKEVERQHIEISIKQQKNIKIKVRTVIKILRQYKYTQIPIHSVEYIIGKLKSKYNYKQYKHKLYKRRVRIGLLLNFEHYEFHAGLDFTKLFESIHEMSVEVNGILKEDAYLHIRRKPGWTNIDLLNHHIDINAGRRETSLLFSPDEMSLLEYGKACDVVLYFQGTAAIAELMMHGVPCVYLGETTGLVRLEAEYISYPESVVPVMSLKSTLEQIKNNVDCFKGLGQTQSEWISEQMSKK